MTWIDQSIANSNEFSNLQVKASLLTKAGKVPEAEAIMQKAIPLATPNQLNRYGYQLLGAGKTKEAIDIFRLNIDKNWEHPFIWGFLDSLGEAYLKDGNKQQALKYYKLAKTKAPESQQNYFDSIIYNVK